jgi:hypothetical protein
LDTVNVGGEKAKPEIVTAAWLAGARVDEVWVVGTEEVAGCEEFELHPTSKITERIKAAAISKYLVFISVSFKMITIFG